MSCLRLSFLGAPVVEVDGRPLAVDTRKAVALLAYLAVTGRAHGRDALAALFWPDYDQTHARAALRRTLSVLNSALGDRWLNAGREQVALDTADLWLDVAAFRAGLSAGRFGPDAPAAEAGRAHAAPLDDEALAALAGAAALYRDDFLTGFSLRDSPAFDEWQFFEAEGLRRDLGAALDRLAVALGDLGQYDRAIEYARRRVALDPLHEPGHRQLMLLYASSGQRSAALRQYQVAAAALDRELGVAPLPETTRLYRMIEANAVPGAGRRGGGAEGQRTVGGAPLGRPGGVTVADAAAKAEAAAAPEVPVSAPAAVAAGPGAYPLVGRAGEWAALGRAYASIAADGRLVALTGEAGIGKTRLAEEFLAGVAQKGAVTLVARCYEGESGLAYAPFVALARSALAARPQALAQMPAAVLADVARLAPEVAALRPDFASAPPLDSPGAQARFFDSLAQVLAVAVAPHADNGGGAAGPGAILLDDLQWADAASLDLFAYLARRLAGRPLCLLAAWRTGHSAAGTVPRLQQVLAEAERGGTGVGLRLRRLTRAAVAELVQTRGLPPDRLAEQLYGETEGLPFFVIEYLEALGQADLTAGWPMPGPVRGLIETRLAGLDEADQQLLAAAAVIGRAFDLETLQAASGRSDEEVADGLDRLLGQGLVVEREAGYDFAHQKLRAVAYERVALARRRILHRRVAAALERRARSTPLSAGALAGTLAQHYAQAGDTAQAALYYRQAGDHAAALYANADALAAYQAALALGHEDQAQLREAAGDMQTLLGDYAAAQASYTAAIEGAAGRQQGGLEHKLGNVCVRRGQWQPAERHFEAALAAAAPAAAAGVMADWSLAAYRQGDLPHALERAQQALARAEQAGEPAALAQAHNLLGILRRSEGDLPAALAHLEQSLALAGQMGDPAMRAAALNNLALTQAAAGDNQRAQELATEALDLCVATGDRHHQAALHNNLADLLHAAGDHEAAMAHLTQAVIIFAEIGSQPGAWEPEVWKLTEW